MSRRTEVYRVVPWTGGVNTSVDPGVLNPQELVQADNVQFSSTGARIKREALEYLDLSFSSPDTRSSSADIRTLTWTSSIVISERLADERLVVGEKITVTGNTDYDVVSVPILSIDSSQEVTSIECINNTASVLDGKYILLSAGDAGIDYYFWFSDGSGAPDPAVPFRTGIEVAIPPGAAHTTVALNLRDAINSVGDFTAVNTTFTRRGVIVTANDFGYAVDATVGNSGMNLVGIVQGGYSIGYQIAGSSFSESTTAAAGVSVARASAVIMVKDYWRYDQSGSTDNISLLVYATNDFQLFSLDSNNRRQQIHGQEQTTTVVCLAASSITTGHYFLINGANNDNNAYVWYNKASGGGDPAIAGRAAIPVILAGTETDAQVASATQAAIDATDAFNTSVSTNTVTITNATSGICDVSVDGNTTFTIATTAYGATNPTSQVARIRTNVFNERLQVYFTGLGNFPIIYNPDEDDKYRLMGQNPATGFTAPDAEWGFNFLSRVWTNDKTDRDLLNYSQTFDETLWLGFGDSGGLPVYPGDGDPQGITNAYPFKTFIVVAKKDARYRVDGDSPENFQINAISAGLGNEGPCSIPIDEVDVVFISRRGIHSQQVTDTYGDTNATYLSADIKPTFSSWEQESLDDIQGTYIPELNSFAISVRESGKLSQNAVWLFNTQVKAAGKDFAGAWYRWPGISCTALSRRLIGGIHKLVFGTIDGRIVQAQKKNNFSDFGTTGILFTIKTGAIYPGGDQQIMKGFKKISMIYRPRGNFSFAVQAKIDNQQQQGFAFNEVSGLDLLGETFILGTSILGSSKVLAPYTSTMEGFGRGVTMTITQPSADEQIEVWGYAIEWENADLAQETN